MENKFDKLIWSDLDEKLFFIQVDKNENNYRIIATNDIKINTNVYISKPFLTFIGNPKDSYIGYIAKCSESFFSKNTKLIDNIFQFTEKDKKFIYISSLVQELFPRNEKDFKKICEIKNINVNNLNITNYKFDPDIFFMKFILNCFSDENKIEVYYTGSYFNQSCIPNCYVDKFGNDFTVRTIKNITKGDELTINYCPSYIFDNKLVRNTLIKTERYFDCKCSGCIGNIYPIVYLYDYFLQYYNFIMTLSHCHSCGKDKELKYCGKCRCVKYCSKLCQIEHWNLNHKNECNKYITKQITKQQFLSLVKKNIH